MGQLASVAHGQRRCGQTTAEGLLYLAYLVLENQLQRHGYVTLHAAAASWATRACCCWDRWSG